MWQNLPATDILGNLSRLHTYPQTPLCPHGNMTASTSPNLCKETDRIKRAINLEKQGLIWRTRNAFARFNSLQAFSKLYVVISSPHSPDFKILPLMQHLVIVVYPSPVQDGVWISCRRYAPIRAPGCAGDAYTWFTHLKVFSQLRWVTSRPSSLTFLSL